MATSWFFNGSGAPDARVGCSRCTGRAGELVTKTHVGGCPPLIKPQSPAMGSDLTKPNIYVPMAGATAREN